MKLLKETINKCYEDCPYNQETFDGGSGCMMVNKDITKYEDNGFPYFCPLPDAEPEFCEWKQDEDGVYFTGCGEGFYFADGTKIGETNFKYCPYCQKPIKIKE